MCCSFLAFAGFCLYSAFFFLANIFTNPSMEIEALKENASLRARNLMLEYKGTHILVTGVCLGSIIFMGLLVVYLVTYDKPLDL